MLAKIQHGATAKGFLKVLEEAQIDLGDEVDVTVEARRVIVSPSQRIRGKYRLEDLAARMPEDYEPVEEDWGDPVGREVW